MKRRTVLIASLMLLAIAGFAYSHGQTGQQTTESSAVCPQYNMNSANNNSCGMNNGNSSRDTN